MVNNPDALDYNGLNREMIENKSTKLLMTRAMHAS